jgi:hypothetical protein
MFQPIHPKAGISWFLPCVLCYQATPMALSSLQVYKSLVDLRARTVNIDNSHCYSPDGHVIGNEDQGSVRGNENSVHD